MAKDSFTYSRKSKSTQAEKDKGKAKEGPSAKDKGKGKVVEQPKPARRVQPRRTTGGTLVIDENRAQRTRPPVVNEREHESSTESESPERVEEQFPPRLVKAVEEDDKCREALHNCDILQTRWADVELLAKLGILEDVRLLLDNMGLLQLLEMDYDCYPEQVIELISSLRVRLREGATSLGRVGTIAFFINGNLKQLTIEEICNAYGFPHQLGQKLESRQFQDDAVWKMIGKGPYAPGRAKSKHISNPAIRYVHKLLANTIFARLEGDRVLDDEMALISNGLQPLFREHFLDEGIRGYEDINLGVLLVKKIQYLRHWALKNSRNKSKLLIGGFLTPLLKAAKLRLNHPCPDPTLRLDFAALKRMNVLTGTYGNRLRYKFVGSDFADHTALLPNEDITRLTSLENVRFANGDRLVSTTTEPAEALLSMHDADARGTRRSTSDLPLGSPRYYFQPFNGRARHEADEYVFETFKKSQKWHKWSARNFHNIKRTYKKQVKAFKEEISGLKNLIKTHIFKKDSAAFDHAMEDVRRNSTSNIPGSSRKRRFQPVPTPSPPSSDNPSIHLSSSEEDGSE